MVMMREWLDLNRCEPTRFDCGTNGAEVVLLVDFSTGVAAEGFARRLGREKWRVSVRPGIIRTDCEIGRKVPSAEIVPLQV